MTLHDFAVDALRLDFREIDPVAALDLSDERHRRPLRYLGDVVYIIMLDQEWQAAIGATALRSGMNPF